MGLKKHYFNKASGCDELAAKLFRSLKDDAIKILHSLCEQSWKTQQWPRDWKRSILIPISKKGSNKKCAIRQLNSSPTLVRSCLKSCMLGFRFMQTKNFQMSYMGLEKEEELAVKLPRFTGLQRKQENFRKTSIFVSLTTLKPWTVWILTKCGKLLERWEYQTILPVS